MNTRTAAIIIDNFLSDDKWDYIKNEVFKSNYIKCIHPTREKNNLWNFISQSLKERLLELNIWENNWDRDLLPGSYINVTTPSIDVELCDNGYHQDDTGFVYYIHPSWNSEWKGALKFKDCLIGEVVPIPNRFVWINENIWHGIGMFNELAKHNRIAVVGWSWPHKSIESVDCDYTINTLVGNY